MSVGSGGLNFSRESTTLRRPFCRAVIRAELAPQAHPEQAYIYFTASVNPHDGSREQKEAGYMSKKKKKGQKRPSDKQYSGIAAHKRQKKLLVPPLMAIPGIKLQSWMNDRLPEMIWCGLLLSHLGRDRALQAFRDTAALIPKLPVEKQTVEPTLSGFAALDAAVLRDFLSTICRNSDNRNALRPLLLFDDLPAKEAWSLAIDQSPNSGDWEYLKASVLPLLDHQSQEATDCRWLRVLFHVVSGKLHVTEEDLREILGYPDFGLQQKVRPSIRAMEGMLDQASKPTSSWPESFWMQSLKDTGCDARHTMEAEWLPHSATTPRRTRDVREALTRHEKSSLVTTAVDARHDAAFGFGAYALAILDELLSMGNSTSILGRIGLRTLLECYVTFGYLITRDDPALWIAYRQYGSGQAKLAFLKFDDPSATSASFVSAGILHQLANEDRWLEFVSIELGHWAATDLRKLSEESGIKADYDGVYPWTSAFTHGNWAAVRNSCFDLCGNPLHRLHRRLRSDTASLGDVIEDACGLVDKILSMVDRLYPGFTERVTLPESKVSPDGSAALRSQGKPLASLGILQREFFQILDQFFRRATGGPVEAFASLDSFGHRIRADAEKQVRGCWLPICMRMKLLVFSTKGLASTCFSRRKTYRD